MTKYEYTTEYAVMSIDLPHAGKHSIMGFPHFFREDVHPIKVQLVTVDKVDDKTFDITLGSVALENPDNGTSLLHIDTYDPWHLGLTMSNGEENENFILRSLEFVEEGTRPYISGDEEVEMPFITWRAGIVEVCKNQHMNGYIEIQASAWREGYKVIQPGVLVWWSEWDE